MPTSLHPSPTTSPQIVCVAWLHHVYQGIYTGRYAGRYPFKSILGSDEPQEGSGELSLRGAAKFLVDHARC